MEYVSSKPVALCLEEKKSKKKVIDKIHYSKYPESQQINVILSGQKCHNIRKRHRKKNIYIYI